MWIHCPVPLNSAAPPFRPESGRKFGIGVGDGVRLAEGLGEAVGETESVAVAVASRSWRDRQRLAEQRGCVRVGDLAHVFNWQVTQPGIVFDTNF